VRAAVEGYQGYWQSNREDAVNPVLKSFKEEEDRLAYKRQVRPLRPAPRHATAACLCCVAIAAAQHGVRWQDGACVAACVGRSGGV
jgi:negative regulator of sigma E activity